MKVVVGLLLVAFLAGCTSSGGDAPEEVPRVSQVASGPLEPTEAVILLSEEVSLTPGGTKTWQVEVPVNATDVHFTIIYPENFFHMGLHVALDGCGQKDFAQGGSIGNGAGSWEYPVCDAADPGPHGFTLTLDRGILDGRAKLVAYVPKA